MKKISEMKHAKFSIIIFSFFVFISCESEIYITNPKMFTEPDNNIYVLDTVQHEIIADGEVDGVKYEIENYDWIITHENGDTIDLIYKEGNIVRWHAQNVGNFQVEVILSIGNKSLREVERIEVEKYGTKIWDFLEGRWKAAGSIGDSIKWISTFNIAEHGIFTARVDTVISGTVKSSLGRIGNDEVVPHEDTDRYFGLFNFLGINHFNGKIKYWDGETSDPHLYSNGEIYSMKFSDDYKRIEMVFVLTEWLNPVRPFITDTVYYEFQKQQLP
jgi:hypothetical protein